MWVCLKIVYPIVPNGFADHYPIIKMAISLGVYPIFRQTHVDNPLLAMAIAICQAFADDAESDGKDRTGSGCVWKCCVPLNPMVNDHYPY